MCGRRKQGKRYRERNNSNERQQKFGLETETTVSRSDPRGRPGRRSLSYTHSPRAQLPPGHRVQTIVTHTSPLSLRDTRPDTCHSTPTGTSSRPGRRNRCIRERRTGGRQIDGGTDPRPKGAKNLFPGVSAPGLGSSQRGLCRFGEGEAGRLLALVRPMFAFPRGDGGGPAGRPGHFPELHLRVVSKGVHVVQILPAVF